MSQTRGAETRETGAVDTSLWFYAHTHLEADRLRVPTRFGVLFIENALLTFLVVRLATLR